MEGREVRDHRQTEAGVVVTGLWTARTSADWDAALPVPRLFEGRALTGKGLIKAAEQHPTQPILAAVYTWPRSELTHRDGRMWITTCSPWFFHASST